MCVCACPWVCVPPVCRVRAGPAGGRLSCVCRRECPPGHVRIQAATSYTLLAFLRCLQYKLASRAAAHATRHRDRRTGCTKRQMSNAQIDHHTILTAAHRTPNANPPSAISFNARELARAHTHTCTAWPERVRHGHAGGRNHGTVTLRPLQHASLHPKDAAAGTILKLCCQNHSVQEGL